MTTHDPVNHPQHYTAHPSGIECLDVVRHLPYELGNVIKYCWLWQNKGGIEDLRKALTYLDYCTTETRALVTQNATAKAQAIVASIVLRKEPEGTPLRAALEMLTHPWDEWTRNAWDESQRNPFDEWTHSARQAIEKTIQEQEAH